MQQQRCLGISVSVGQTTVLQTTQQLAGIRVGDVEIAHVDDMSIGDDSPISRMSVQWRPFANVVTNQQR
jgi:hypothetical protein